MFRIKLRPTDRLFSKYIRKRDDYTCQRCRKTYEPNAKGLECSHYWGRGRENTRFDPLNCIALCTGCHRIWGHGDGRDEYRDFMLKKLGRKGFDSLDARAHTHKKRDDNLDRIAIAVLIKELE